MRTTHVRPSRRYPPNAQRAPVCPLYVVGGEQSHRSGACGSHRSALRFLSNSSPGRRRGTAASPSPHSDTSDATIFCLFQRLQGRGRARRRAAQTFRARVFLFLNCNSVRVFLDLCDGLGGQLFGSYSVVAQRYPPGCQLTLSDLVGTGPLKINDLIIFLDGIGLLWKVFW